MVGKGSVNHNSRQFHAKNTDPARSHLNKEYVNDDIRAVYHELFDEAVARYNARQTRQDRCIGNYYEKIRSGKQEKPFHELILQIGSKDDCGAETPEGGKAAQMLDEYIQGFQQRNPSLRVFSAHLHMDEATPHLHIDFVPYTTGSKRGLDTRVSLKQALAALGFKGGTRGMTEWNQWVNAEKRQLAAIMQQHDIGWLQKGTHEEHLDVLDYKKQARAKEVADLTEQAEQLEIQNSTLQSIQQAVTQQLIQGHQEMLDQQKERDKALEEAEAARKQEEEYKDRIKALTPQVNDLESWAEKYSSDPEKILPKAGFFESATTYRERIKGIIRKMGKTLRSLYAKFKELTKKYEDLERKHSQTEAQLSNLNNRFHLLREENDHLWATAQNLTRVRNILGDETVSKAIDQSLMQEEQERQQKRKRISRDQPSL